MSEKGRAIDLLWIKGTVMAQRIQVHVKGTFPSQWENYAMFQLMKDLDELPIQPTLQSTSYCASCGVIPVNEPFEYCDACIDDIVAYLEKDEMTYRTYLTQISAKEEGFYYEY